jgi:hypothetical protein
MRRCDPRIHFALNCGARSCPQIAIYSSANLEKALNMATASYCNSEIEVLPANNEIRLSKLFLWYKNDFGRSETEILRLIEIFINLINYFFLLFRWITKFIDEPKQSLLKIILDQPARKEALHISYKIYNWMLNLYDNSVSNTPNIPY